MNSSDIDGVYAYLRDEHGIHRHRIGWYFSVPHHKFVSHEYAARLIAEATGQPVTPGAWVPAPEDCDGRLFDPAAIPTLNDPDGPAYKRVHGTFAECDVQMQAVREAIDRPRKGLLDLPPDPTGDYLAMCTHGNGTCPMIVTPNETEAQEWVAAHEATGHSAFYWQTYSDEEIAALPKLGTSG